MTAAERAVIPSGEVASKGTLQVLAISSITLHPDCQCRAKLVSETIKEYAKLVKSGVEFPQVRVWHDGAYYWSSDGFHRIRAHELAGRLNISAEAFKGTLSDAIWDACRANATHGLQRSRANLVSTIRRLLEHPNGADLTTAELARHMQIPESTFRYWRRRLAGERMASVRRVTRKGKTYVMNTESIGRKRSRSAHCVKSKSVIDHGLREMKEQVSPWIQAVLTVVGNWVCGPAEVKDCVRALDGIQMRFGTEGGNARHGKSTAVQNRTDL
jgi:hypothetical protein